MTYRRLAEIMELRDWLDAIAKDIKEGNCRDGIIEHLRKHANEKIGTDIDLRDWMASLVNLVEIAKRVFDITPTVREQLNRLQAKFEKEGIENGYTPNPTRGQHEKESVNPHNNQTATQS